ncbi:MAG: FecR domain-containing protein [Xanthobacteraceae bacterium]
MRRRSLFLIVPVVMLTATPAVAQQVGTAPAVNPQSESTPPGGTTAPLIVGAHIVRNERIHTTPDGTVQLRFTDKSSMSIAPNTDIVINEYVYDPNANSGHLLATLTKGALRYVGGELSHAGATTITTSAANIGVRGGTATISHGPNGTEVIDNAALITIQNGVGTFVLLRSDFGASARSWNSPIIDLGRIPQSRIGYLLALLTSKNGQNGGVPGFNNANIGHCGFGNVSGTNCPQTGWTPTNTGELNANKILGNAARLGVNQITPPPAPPVTTPPVTTPPVTTPPVTTPPVTTPPVTTPPVTTPPVTTPPVTTPPVTTPPVTTPPVTTPPVTTPPVTTPPVTTPPVTTPPVTTPPVTTPPVTTPPVTTPPRNTIPGIR